MWLLPLSLVLLSFIGGQAGAGVIVDVDADWGDKIEEAKVIRQIDEDEASLQFPPRFYKTENQMRLNHPDFIEEMHELGWTMCDSYRRVELELASPEVKSAFRTLVLMFQLKSNPMEPQYHQTCLKLFEKYPNMAQRIKDKEDLFTDFN